MIIDKILDRKAGHPYNPKTFYNEMMAYGEMWPIGHDIADAMDEGAELDVRNALKRYLDEFGYEDIKLIAWIDSVKWLE